MVEVGLGWAAFVTGVVAALAGALSAGCDVAMTGADPVSDGSVGTSTLASMALTASATARLEITATVWTGCATRLADWIETFTSIFGAAVSTLGETALAPAD
ncbi:MAG: hypothetical protein C0414_10840 [Brevundimonas sp.]|nr:hypothetical protein [Brevundimonas sp.]